MLPIVVKVKTHPKRKTIPKGINGFLQSVVGFLQPFHLKNQLIHKAIAQTIPGNLDSSGDYVIRYFI